MCASKMKILVTGPYPPPYSGPETSIKLLTESPLKEMATIQLLDINYRKDMASKGKRDWKRFAAFFSILFRLFWRCATFRPHIVYYYVTATIGGWICKDIWVIFLAWLMGRNVVIHMRAGHFMFNYRSAHKWQQALIRCACHCCAAGLVQADVLKNQFEGLFPPEKIFTVYNMIDIQKYRNNAPYQYEEKRFFFMGLISYAKGYCDLLSVIPRIAADYPDCKFVFAGYRLKEERNIFQEQTTGKKLTAESPDECYQRYIEKRCEKNYLYLGALDDEHKMEELRKCHAFILPSYSEGFSMAVLEALAMSKAVICTPVGALGEVVRDKINGMVVPAGDRQALENAIRTVIADKQLCRHMIDSNGKYVENNFSQLKIAQRLFEIFTQLVEIKK